MRLLIELAGRRLLDLEILPPRPLSVPDVPPDRDPASTSFAQVELAPPAPTVLFGFRAHDPEEDIPWPG